MPPRPKQLGPYTIGDKLGQGGMGSVYVGHDGDERVAVKVLAPALAGEEGFRARFEAEIDSLKKLSHPNIVRLFAYGEQDAYLYYAMELVVGTSLEEELREGRRFNWREVTRMSIGICRALKHAHDHGVIHRDVKPANLLLATDSEIVKITDFGIARLFGNFRMTNEGGVLGTAEYMAPEQADGRVVTDRCDQYSLGGVMYALLAGRPPFRANSLVEMLQLQRFGEPQPVRYFAPDTPLELERIIHQLLSKDPQKRFANTLFLARALEAMELALSRNLGRVDFVVTHEASPEMQLTQTDPLAVTLLPEESSEVKSAAHSQNPSDHSSANRKGAQPNGLPVADDPSSTDAGEIPAPVVRFTKVETHAVAPTSALRDFLTSLVSPQVLSLAAGLLVVGLAAMWLIEPASADKLYARIEQVAQSDDPEALLEAEGSIDDFLARFPEDERAGEIAGLREQLELTKQERRLERTARRPGGAADGKTPLERAYLAAAALAGSRPERALARFRSLVDLCESDTHPTPTHRQLLELARRQRDRLEAQVNRLNAADRLWAQAELDRAAELAPTDPATADKMRRAIVELLGERPALADVVSAARAALGEQLGSRN